MMSLWSGMKTSGLTLIRTNQLLNPSWCDKLKLYTNNYQPIFSSVSTSFVEASFAGYAALANLSTWAWSTPPQVDAQGIAYITAPDVEWTFTGGAAQLVYGYFVIGSQGEYHFGEKVWAEGLNLSTPGQKVVLRPRFLFDEYRPAPLP